MKEHTIYGLPKKVTKKIRKELEKRLMAFIEETTEERIDVIFDNLSRKVFTKDDTITLNYNLDFSAAILLGIIGEERTKTVKKAAKRNKF